MDSNERVFQPELPYLTADMPGVGGAIKQREDDFVVEEIPLYEPCGEGTHVYLRIEKRGRTTLSAVQAIADALGRKPRDIGYAGLKDAQAVTRQTLSIEHVDAERVRALRLPRIEVVSVSHHGNKLKLGHLSGNRFSLKIRDTVADAAARASVIVDQLARRGVPNFFGPQRFGARGDNADVGCAVLKGDLIEALAVLLGRPGPTDHSDVARARELFDEGRYAEAADAWPGSFREQIRVGRAMARANGNARRAWSTVSQTLRKLYLSAAQSLLFNEVLSGRIEQLGRLYVGDMAWKHVNGACFRVEDVAVEQPRCDALEISPSGPLFGKRMTEASGAPGEAEKAVLADSGLKPDDFHRIAGVKLSGARRPLRVPLQGPVVEDGRDEHGPFLLVCFALPPGSYATSVAREICKGPQARR